MDTNERCNHGTTIDANMASAAVDGHDISSQDQEVRKKDSHPEAVLMIPPNGEEPPLTQNELRMEFGAPIIEHGIDYTCIREEYLAAVNNETIPDERKLPSLAELIRQEAKSQRLLDFGLLIAHDSRQHQKECHSNFKMWVRKKFGVKMVRQHY